MNSTFVFRLWFFIITPERRLLLLEHVAAGGPKAPIHGTLAENRRFDK